MCSSDLHNYDLSSMNSVSDLQTQSHGTCQDCMSVVEGQSVDLGGRGSIINKNTDDQALTKHDSVLKKD